MFRSEHHLSTYLLVNGLSYLYYKIALLLRMRLSMPEIWSWMTGGFMAHGYCLRWDGPLLSAFILGNLGIALAYFLIPTALRYFIGKRKD